ncbi:MAG: DUF87 domain-containing protein [Patescibacteria group bacterium]|nr:DUF87 domain-containing protein [Patescibacteria group bacterium]
MFGLGKKKNIAETPVQASKKIELADNKQPVTLQKQKPVKISAQNLQAEKVFRQGMLNVLDIISPAAFTVTPNYVQLGGYFIKTLFVYTYPRFLQTNWLSPIINYDITCDISMFIYPIKTNEIMGDLRKKVSQLESTKTMEQEKGYVRNPELETAISDIEGLRDVLQRGEIRLFQYSLYFTVYAKSLDELNTITKQLESTLGGMLVYTKQALLQMEQGFNSCVPIGDDEMAVRRNLDTGSLSTTFPFTSAELTTNEGVLYGINRHNNSLILFDRFKLENANSVVFAKAGAGKSYAVKLEVLRSLMLGTDIIVLDPENEYKALCEAVGGSYLPLSLNAEQRINPFDLPHISNANDPSTGEEILRSAIVSLKGLVGLMLGALTPEEDAILDKALYETYALKDITADPESHKNPPPLMVDLQNVLNNMTGAESLSRRMQKYTEGTFAGLFNKPTNFEIDRGFVVFSIRDLEDQLRPIGMYMALNYIWNKVRFDTKKRIMVIDEAWIMMQHEDSAKFLYALAKRCRKYYLGLTVITQDVEDFLASQYGRAVISNSSMQMLLKQSPSSVEKVAEIFNLTEGEKYLLLESDVGEGLFFAGLNHVAIKIVASFTEDQLITTDPRQLIEIRKASQKQEEE